MNRQQRRAAARGGAKADRPQAIVQALDALALASAADPTVTGATLMLPNGEVLHLDAETARAMRRTDGSMAGSA